MNGRPAHRPTIIRRVVWSPLALVLCATQVGCSDDVLRLGQTTESIPGTPPATVGTIEMLILRDAASTRQIRDLTDTTPISIAKLRSSKINLVSIEAVTAGPVASVDFSFDNLPAVNEHQVPFTYPGDADGKLYGLAIKLGSHRVTATPYSALEALGEKGASVSVELNFVD